MAVCGLAVTSTGCRLLSGPPPARVDYGGQSCWRLANGTVDLVVNPGTGRIVRYGYVGGKNILWENPQAVQQAPNPKDWKNWGGDRVCPWPQTEWPNLIGHDWPPPGDGDIPPYTVERTGAGLRMTSAELPGFGMRVVRDIELAPSGSRVTIRNRLEPVGFPKSIVTWAAWTITQMVTPELIFARLDPGARTLDHTFVGKDPFLAPTRFGNILQLNPDPTRGCKVGLDADRLAGVSGEHLFIQTLVKSGTTRGTYAPGEKAQLFSLGGSDPVLTGSSYLEMELTSPCVDIHLVCPELTVEWQLRRLSPPERDPVALRKLIEFEY